MVKVKRMDASVYYHNGRCTREWHEHAKYLDPVELLIFQKAKAEQQDEQDAGVR